MIVPPPILPLAPILGALDEAAEALPSVEKPKETRKYRYKFAFRVEHSSQT